MEDIQDKGKDIPENFTSIYLIVAHDVTKNFQLSLSNNTGLTTSEIEIIIEQKFLCEKQFNFISKVYKFNVYNFKNEFEIFVKFKEEGNDKKEYIGKITDKDIGKIEGSHFFLYDFTPIDNNQNSIFSLKEFPLSHCEQFELYFDSLKQIGIEKNSNLELIQSITLFFSDEKAKYDFKFYLLVFIHCYNTKLINNHLLSFDSKKLVGLGEFNEEELQSYKETINVIASNLDMILLNIEEQYKSKASTYLCTIIVYFNLKFQKERLIPISNTKKFYDSIFSNNSILFELLEYDEMKTILSLPTDCFTILSTIYTYKNIILDKFNEEIKKIELLIVLIPNLNFSQFQFVLKNQNIIQIVHNDLMEIL